MANSRVVRAARGTELSCKGWVQEAALRMLMNNLDPEVAERPEDLVVYGGSGKAARSWEAYDRIVASLKDLGDEETLLVQSGKAVGIVKSHRDAPRVLIANSNLVPKWATWETFRELEDKGLTMFGQMTAGSWIYIGTQGILQGTYETFRAAAQKHYGPTADLTGKLVLTAGLGGMGGAQPLAVTMNGGVCIAVEIDPQRITRRVEQKYCDTIAYDLENAVEQAREAQQKGKPISIGLLGNAADIFPAFLEWGVIPDLVTDQTSAHDLLQGYVPRDMTLDAASRLRKSDPGEYQKRSVESVVRHVKAMVGLSKAGANVFDYGNNIRAQAKNAGYAEAFAFPGFVPAYIRPQFCEGRGPFRWVALSGDPEDIHTTDRELMKLFPDDAGLNRWLKLATERVKFQGLPARICWLGYGERHKAGLLFNDLVAQKKVKAPIVIGRDHLDSGSVASPYRETEAMKDGSDAIADWVYLNAMANAVNGASWVSVHHGGGVGIGYSLHAGQVIVADGTPDAARRLERVLLSDPALGVMRHADAGYDEAIDVAKARGVKIPGLA